MPSCADNRVRDPPIIGRNHDPADQLRLLNPPVNVLYERFTVDFEYWLSRETSGMKPGRDDRNGGLKSHQRRYSLMGHMERVTIPRWFAHNGQKHLR